MSRPFFLGDIVSMALPGQAPGGPAENLTGFVEHFTWFYLVVRDFNNKQTWIRYSDFARYVVQNWTRRHTKPVNLIMSLSADTKMDSVKQLLDFAKKWVDASENVDQHGYKKVCLSHLKAGYGLTIIFFTKVGASKKAVRQEFLLDFMKESERLQVSVVPVSIVTEFRSSQAHAADMAANLDAGS